MPIFVSFFAFFFSGGNDELIVVDDCKFIHFVIVDENVDYDLVDIDRRELVDDPIVDTDADRENRDQTTEVIVTGSDQIAIIKD